MNTVIQKPIESVSFDVGANQPTHSVRLVLSLIKESLESSKPITISAIRWAYTDYAMARKTNGTGYFYDSSTSKKRRAKTRAEWYSWYSSDAKAREWFKSNLGSAILKGKLMVIPVIEID